MWLVGLVTYGCESWTLIRMKKHVLAHNYEMEGLRKIQRVSWTAKKTNKWVQKVYGIFIRRK